MKWNEWFSFQTVSASFNSYKINKCPCEFNYNKKYQSLLLSPIAYTRVVSSSAESLRKRFQKDDGNFRVA